MERNDWQYGFTLVELLLVVGLIAVVLALALPSWHAFLFNVAIDRDVARLTAAIQRAQTNAIKEMRPWRVVLNGDGSGGWLEYRDQLTEGAGLCESPGWEAASPPSTFTFTPELHVAMSTASRRCIPFGPVGQPIWPKPFLNHLSTTANSLGSVPYLLDGKFYTSWAPEIENASAGPLVYFPQSATRQPVVLIFDLQEVRYLRAPCLGLYYFPPTSLTQKLAYVYPTRVQYQVAETEYKPGEMVWAVDRTLPSGLLPANILRGTKDVRCIPLPIDAQGRSIRLTLDLDTQFSNPKVVVHEFDITPLHMDVVEKSTKKVVRQLQINAATGRITSR